MSTQRRHRTTPSNAGLLALEAMLAARYEPPGASALDAGSSAAAADLLVATDGIALTLFEDLAPADEAAAIRRAEALLGPGWTLRDDSLDAGGDRFRGVMALPPPDNAPPVSEAWAMARALAAVEGFKSATPLFAQVAPGVALRGETALGMGAGAEGPTDPDLRRDWHRSALRVPQAWQYSRLQGREPGQGVIVAVVDTGYTDHPEVVERLTKVDEQSDQVRGLDLLDGQDPRDPLEGRPPLAFPGHGTSVASVIVSPEGRPANWPANKDWLTGIAPAARVMPVRMTTNVALLLPNKITPAIRQAVDAGADVINVSLGLPYYWPALHAAIRYAAERGVIVVAASGNFWPVVVYPARFPEVLAAAGCGWTLREWKWASSGDAVDVLTPGVAVQSAYSQRGEGGRVTYTVRPGTGTTFAAACSSGLAALWLARHGGRPKLIDHYQGAARRVPQAFHYLVRDTALALPDVPVGRYGEGLPQADALLRADLPSVDELERDAWGLRLHTAPLVEAQHAVLPGLALEEMITSFGIGPGIKVSLSQEALGSLSEELSSEVGLHLASRPEMCQALLAGRAAEVRAELLKSKHLSSALRRQLEAIETVRPMTEGEAVRVIEPGFRRREATIPTRRSLQVFAFDPSLAGSLRTVDYNLATVGIPWEKLDPGPVGEYLEVVDIDPASECAYEPVDLDHPHVLSTGGVNPDEGDPWFHQQMAYAVAMKTISHFEAALGRPAMWAVGRQKEGKEREPFYQRLRIYPHALRERNAYYSPEKRALLFGYFRSPGSGGAPNGPLVFTCLSYDIVAHETTHALLDGMYHHYVEDTNLDMLAFHEAFADIVALFQHFTHPEVLRAAIAETRGDLETDSLLGKLAQQFGEATGKRGALRDAIGYIQDDRWHRRQPDPSLLERPDHQESPHRRGSLLVAAVFDAFLKIYQRRTRAVIRVATGGSGELRAGELPADLAAALAQEAAKTARHVLNLCIRALDYLPPVNITFGEYLRAVITADRDLAPDDPLGYRVAFVEAFRAWGIRPAEVSTVAPESLCWSRPEGLVEQFALSQDLLDILNRLLPAWRVNRSRRELHEGTVQAKIRFHMELEDLSNRALGAEIGIDLSRKFQIHTLRPATTLGPDGLINPMVVVTLLQKKEQDGKPMIRTGSTLLFSRGDGRIRYAIHKRDSRGTRAEETARHLRFRLESIAQSDPYGLSLYRGEPFAALHLTGHL